MAWLAAKSLPVCVVLLAAPVVLEPIGLTLVELRLCPGLPLRSVGLYAAAVATLARLLTQLHRHPVAGYLGVALIHDRNGLADPAGVLRYTSIFDELRAEIASDEP